MKTSHGNADGAGSLVAREPSASKTKACQSLRCQGVGFRQRKQRGGSPEQVCAHGRNGDTFCEAEKSANRQEHGGGVAGGPRSEEGGDGPKHHAPRHHSLAPVSVRKCSSGDVRDRITPQERRLPKTSSEKSDEFHFLDFRSWQSLHESTLKPVQAMSSLTRKQPQRAPRRQRQCFMVLTSAVSDLTVTFTLWMSHISR
ncbi:hypothetical protein BHE74_00005477 [Ensete ventricosum]|nr:hypothetical protein BHE74_00005477 [Ensete ventricosum]